jgi:hypothetical protein
MHIQQISKWSAIALGAWLIFLVALTLLFRPSHDRVWEPGHEALPLITIQDEQVTITNYRHFKWTGALEAARDYETRSFSLADITSVSVLISHFSDFEGLAHIFLSFELVSDTPVVVSLETRREVGEEFSPILGIFRQFEIIYVVGDERDLVGVRTDHRDERVYLYPTKATSEQAQALFLRLTEKINGIYAKPQMYNTLLRNCTNEITREVEKMTELSFPLTWKTILPGYFDEVLYKMGIIDNSLPFPETKQNQLIDNSKVSASSDSYSQDLRRSLGIE